MKLNGKSIFSNWQAKILCFVAAVVVYFIGVYGIQQKRVIALPLEVKLPDSYVATSIYPKEVNLIISGSEDVIHVFDVSKYSLVADFSNVDKEGVSSASIVINTNKLDDYVKSDNYTMHTDPSYLKIYFEKK